MVRVPEVIPSYTEQFQGFLKKYEAETALAVKVVFATNSLLAIEIFNMPFAKVVKNNLALAKATYLLPSALSSFQNFLTMQVNSPNDGLRDISATALIPFTLISLASTKIPYISKSLSEIAGFSNFKCVDEFLKASPVFSHLKFAGIPNIATIGLLASFAFDAYAKVGRLTEQKENLPLDQRAIKQVEIEQNHWGLVEKTVKVASTVFSFAVTVGSYSHPAITAIKITFLVAEVALAAKKYQTKYLEPKSVQVILSPN